VAIFDVSFYGDDDAFILALLQKEALMRSGGGINVGVVQTFYLNFSNTVTVQNTVTETNLLTGTPDAGSQTITPNVPRVAQLYRLSFRATVQTNGVVTLTFRLKLGATTIATYTGSINTTLTELKLDVFAMISAIGAGGSIIVRPTWYEVRTAGTGALLAAGSAGGTTAIDFSTNETWQLSAQWGAADPGHVLTFNFTNIDYA